MVGDGCRTDIKSSEKPNNERAAISYSWHWRVASRANGEKHFSHCFSQDSALIHLLHSSCVLCARCSLGGNTNSKCLQTVEVCCDPKRKTKIFIVSVENSFSPGRTAFLTHLVHFDLYVSKVQWNTVIWFGLVGFSLLCCKRL